jgi:hypothetical protein
MFDHLGARVQLYTISFYCFVALPVEGHFYQNNKKDAVPIWAKIQLLFCQE